MKFYQSIRFRIMAAVLVFGTLLIVLNTGITFFILGKTLSRLVNNLVETEADYFLYKYNKDHTTPLPHSKYITVFKDIEEVPPHLRDLVRDKPPGVHSISGHRKGPPRQVAVLALPGKASFYYMVFHAREFFDENTRSNPKKVLGVSLALLLLPALVLAFVTSRMLFRPIAALMEKIRGLDPDNIPAQWSDSQSANEIGMLTRTIEGTMARINAFIQREKQFSRDASHELRTPLTIVKGAVEVIEQQPEAMENPLIKRPLARISHSVNGMETLINAFLWLAREETGPAGTCRVAPVVKRAVDDNRHLIANKDILVRMDCREDAILNVGEEILYIAAANLVRNAFDFTPRGSVAILATDLCLEVRDTGTGIPEDRLDSVAKPHVKDEKSAGFGLGLSIVSRLCDRFGWTLSIGNRREKGTRVRILWGPDATDPDSA